MSYLADEAVGQVDLNPAIFCKIEQDNYCFIIQHIDDLMHNFLRLLGKKSCKNYHFSLRRTKLRISQDIC